MPTHTVRIPRQLLHAITHCPYTYRATACYPTLSVYLDSYCMLSHTIHILDSYCMLSHTVHILRQLLHAIHTLSVYLDSYCMLFHTIRILSRDVYKGEEGTLGFTPWNESPPLPLDSSHFIKLKNIYFKLDNKHLLINQPCHEVNTQACNNSYLTKLHSQSNIL